MAPRIAGAALCLLLCACAHGPGAPGAAPPAVTSHEDPRADFGRYRTYGYMQPLDTDESDGTRSRLSSLLIQALDRELEARGFRRADDPDLRVNFAVQTDTRQTVAPSGPPPRYTRGRYRQWRGHEATPLEYTEGTLSIDLVDAGSETVVWEGLAQGPMRGSLDEVTPERAADVVGRVLQGFHHRVEP